MVCVTEWERKTHKLAGEEQKKKPTMKKKSWSPDPKNTKHKGEPQKLNKVQTKKSKVSNQKAVVPTRNETEGKKNK